MTVYKKLPITAKTPTRRGGKHDEMVHEQRRHQVAQLYLEGKTQWEIAVLIGVSQPTVSCDLIKIRTQWKERNDRAWSEKLEEEQAKIDKLELMALEGYERSMKDAVVTIKSREKALAKEAEEVDDNGKGKTRKDRASAKKALMRVVKETRETKRSGQVGDHGFLRLVTWCLDTRLKIMGAYKEENKTTVNNLIVRWDELYERGPRPSDKIEERIAGELEQA